MTTRSRPQVVSGFTLVEVLVSMAILSLIMVVLVSMTDAARKSWSYTTSKSEQFRDAQEAYEAITRRLSQATLNTYLDYQYTTSGGVQIPSAYMRRSELRFISGQSQPAGPGSIALLPSSYTYPTAAGNRTNYPSTQCIFFQAPTGAVTDQASYPNMDSLLNTCGYFIEYGSDAGTWPAFIASMTTKPPERYRFRVKELLEPADTLTLYNYTSGANGATPPVPYCTTYNTTEWFTKPVAAQSPYTTATRPVRTLAENIVALVFLPKLSKEQDPTGIKLSPSYSYDSTKTDDNNDATASDPTIDWKNQVPPIVQMTMVAVDEASFSRLNPGSAQPLLTTGLFADASKYQTDLYQLEANLSSRAIQGGATTFTSQVPSHVPLNYRVFTTNVSIKAAKWSRNQTY